MNYKNNINLMDEIKQLCIISKSMREAYSKLSININFKTFVKYAKLLNVYNPNQSGKGLKKQGKYKIKMEDILSNKVPFPNTYKLKNRLFNQGYKKEICECCNNTTWLNNKIPLELHHKDGNTVNNNLNNLEILCPNCHALTDNYRAKNKKNLYV